jgi:hypothetical protein
MAQVFSFLQFSNRNFECTFMSPIATMFSAFAILLKFVTLIIFWLRQQITSLSDYKFLPSFPFFNTLNIRRSITTRNAYVSIDIVLGTSHLAPYKKNYLLRKCLNWFVLISLERDEDIIRVNIHTN